MNTLLIDSTRLASRTNGQTMRFELRLCSEKNRYMLKVLKLHYSLSLSPYRSLIFLAHCEGSLVQIYVYAKIDVTFDR